MKFIIKMLIKNLDEPAGTVLAGIFILLGLIGIVMSIVSKIKKNLKTRNKERQNGNEK